MYNFFVADEAQVPAWDIEPPRDPDAIDYLSKIFVDSGFELKPVLKAIFLSDFFKEAMYQKVKSPAEVVVGTLRLTGDMKGPDKRLMEMGQQTNYMGQSLHDPPSVEGWQTGRDWINSGSVVKRINFVADHVSNLDLPGVQSIVRRVATNGAQITPDALVDRCVELIGPLEISDETRGELLAHAEDEGPISYATDVEYAELSRRVGDMLALIAATVEYQFG